MGWNEDAPPRLAIKDGGGWPSIPTPFRDGLRWEALRLGHALPGAAASKMWSSPGEKDPTILTGALQRAGQGWPWTCISAGCLPLLNLLPSPPFPGVGSQGCSLKPPARYNPPWSWLPGKPSLAHQDVSLAPQEMWWKLSVVNTWGMRPGLNTGSGRSARATQWTRRSKGPTRPGRTGPRAKDTARVHARPAVQGKEGSGCAETELHQGQQGPEGTEQNDSKNQKE